MRPAAVEVELDEDLRLLGLPLDPRGPAHPSLRSSVPSAMHLGECLLERRHLVGGADRDPQPAVRAGLPDQHAAVEQRLPDSMTVLEAAEQYEVGVARRRPASPCSRSQATVPSRSARSSSTLPSSSRRVPQRRQRDRLGDRRQVVGQPHDAQRVADLGCGGEVAQPGPGQRERLAHRAGDDQVAVLRAAARARWGCRRGGTRRTPRRPPPARRRARRGLAQRRDRLGRQRGAGRVVRRRQQHHARPLLLDQRARVVEVEGEVRLAVAGHPLGDRVAGVLGIHRVRRREAERHPARAAERLQELQHHLVGAVGRPDLVGASTPVAEVAPPAPRAARRTRGRGSGSGSWPPRRPRRRCRPPPRRTAGRGSR